MRQFIKYNFSKKTRQCELFNDINNIFDQIKSKYLERRQRFERKRIKVIHKHKINLYHENHFRQEESDNDNS